MAIFRKQTIPAKDMDRERRIFNFRALIAMLMVFAGLSVLAGRMVYLQVVTHDHFATLSDKNRVKLQPLQPARGLIYDRNGVLLAGNLISNNLLVTPGEVADLDQTLELIKTRILITDSEIERFRKRVRSNPSYNGIPLRFNMSDEEVARLGVSLHRLPGVAIVPELTRNYPQGEHAVHVVGYVGRINERDLQRVDLRQYRGSHHIGKIGIERKYETLLRGRLGSQQVETNAQGRVLRTREHTPPVSGKHIYLTIDSRLQHVAEEALKGHNGAIVAIDVNNGEVLAMASMPVYDPNPFVNGIDVKSYRALLDSPDRPLYDRALQGMYPPGSTIKPFVALAGLEYGLINHRHSVYCPGHYRLPGKKRKFRDWKRWGHGYVNLYLSLAQSCDVYYYDLAYHMGIGRMRDYLQQFGLGEDTGIDLIGEKSGLLPSPEWKGRRYKKLWYTGETLITGIGQGYMLTTPLQLAHATATLAKRGKRYRPRLLLGVREAGREAVVKSQSQELLPAVPVKNYRHWNQVVQGMIAVVHGRRGTAHGIGRNLEYQIAGKTGTAQVFSLGQNEEYDAKKLAKHLHDHALFIAFAPARKPQIAVAVVVEHGGGGSTTAAPMARKVLDAYFSL